MPAGEHLRRRYPGLIPAEAAVWREWLVEHELEWERFEYNVHVGPGVEPSPDLVAQFPATGDRMARQFYQATRKRIDVVGYKGPAVGLFEVEERIEPGALGQILVYRQLWIADRPPRGPLLLFLIARELSPGMDVGLAPFPITVNLIG